MEITKNKRTKLLLEAKSKGCKIIDMDLCYYKDRDDWLLGFSIMIMAGLMFFCWGMLTGILYILGL